MKLDSFTQAYIEAALWSSTRDEMDSDEPQITDEHGFDDLAPETLRMMRDDCAKFQAAHYDLLNEDNCSYRGCDPVEYAGHDFWLTRCGHGCGFWDGDWAEPHATVLTEAAKAFGNVELYVGDDGLIYAT